MRNIAVFLAVFAVLSSIATCQAQTYVFDQTESSTDITAQILDDIDFDSIKIPDEAAEVIGDDFTFLDLFGKDGLARAARYAVSELSAPLRFAAAILAAVLVCALFSSVQSTERLHKPSTTAANLVFTCLCAPLVAPLISAGAQSVQSLGVFMYSFVPVFVAVLAMGLHSGVAAGVSPTLFLSAQSIMLLSDKIIVPLSSSCVAIGIASALSSDRLNGLTKSIKKIVIFSISLFITVFLGILTLKTAVFKTADSLGLKTAKFFTGAFIPIVGQSLAEMLSGVMSCIGTVRSTVGIYGIIAAVLTALPSVVKITVYKLVTEICVTLCQALSQDGYAKLLKAFCDVMTIMLAVILICTAMCVFTVAIVTIAVGGS